MAHDDDREKDGLGYMEGKMQDRGYPGIAAGWIRCKYCNNPVTNTLLDVHDCYEKRNGIQLSKQDEDTAIGSGGAHWKIHQFKQRLGDKLCYICGEPPDWAGHVGPDIMLGSKKPKITDPWVVAEIGGEHHVNIEVLNIPNDQAMRIVQIILPKALELYLRKSKDYGGNVMDRFGLGQKAAIPDMARKFGKLIDSIWHGKKLEFEQEDEILYDLLGHILIILDQRAEGK